VAKQGATGSDRLSIPPEGRTADDWPMSGVRRQIVAFGGGGFSMEAGNPLLDDYVLELARERRERPRVCFLPTASGDADHYIVRFYRAFTSDRCEPSHVSLFRRDGGTADPAAHLHEQDLVYVGGGNVISLLGVLRAHGLDGALREAWKAGVVMAGLSAGSRGGMRAGWGRERQRADCRFDLRDKRSPRIRDSRAVPQVGLWVDHLSHGDDYPQTSSHPRDRRGWAQRCRRGG
jgi:hypothetical protein